MYVESNHFLNQEEKPATRHGIKFCGPRHCFELGSQNDFLKDSMA